MFLIGVIRVITITDEKLLKRHGEIIERALPGVKTISMCIEDQPKGIYDDYTEKIAIPKIIRLAKDMEKKVHGIIISCAGDPAVDILSKELKIPVIGAGRPTASLALSISDKIGVLGITDEPPRPFKEVLGDKIIAYEKPPHVETTIDLSKNKETIIEAAKKLEKAGAEVIALACTGFSTIGIASILSKKLSIPVIDPVLATATTMYYHILFKYSIDEVLRK